MGWLVAWLVFVDRLTPEVNVVLNVHRNHKDYQGREFNPFACLKGYNRLGANFVQDVPQRRAKLFGQF